jgi:DNA-binding XRE family transcriptional regulator
MHVMKLLERQRDTLLGGQRHQGLPVANRDGAPPPPEGRGGIARQGKRPRHSSRPAQIGEDVDDHTQDYCVLPLLGQGQNAIFSKGKLSFDAKGQNRHDGRMPTKPYKHDDATGSAWVAECAERVVWLRHICATSQSEAYTTLGIDQSTWSMIELGKRGISINNALKICNSWGASLDYIYRGIIGSAMRQDVALRLAAAHPGLVLGREPGTAAHARVVVPASSDAS